MVAAGTTAYSHGEEPCVGNGVSLTGEELDVALTDSVSEIVYDDAGKADLAALMSGLSETDFEHDRIVEILNQTDPVEDWRVGEALAEAYLGTHRACTFPWPDGRDERKQGSSLPGADLVGFQANDDGEHKFAFGEVKTSTEDKHPPQLVYGRHGLKQQLEDLRDRADIRDQLVKYLGYRARGADWVEHFRNAAKRYLLNGSDVSIFGVLVRDVTPNVKDVSARVDKLGNGCPAGTDIELLALYLPPNQITGLGTTVAAIKQGGA